MSRRDTVSPLRLLASITAVVVGLSLQVHAASGTSKIDAPDNNGGASAYATPAEVPPGANGSLPLVWKSSFSNGLADWPSSTRGWGEKNRSFTTDPAVSGQVLRLLLPKGSIDPVQMKRRGLPIGGTGFKAHLPGQGYEIARLRYKVRFPADFEQGKGGKLPGLCGGVCNAGGKIPNGADGFSARYVWTGNFAASVYAYLPESKLIGTGVGIRKIPLRRGEWVELVQEVRLNTVGSSDGYIKIWSDGKFVVNAQGITFRTSNQLRIDQVFFDVFFGGNTDEWAAPKDTILEFAEFYVWAR